MLSMVVESRSGICGTVELQEVRKKDLETSHFRFFPVFLQIQLVFSASVLEIQCAVTSDDGPGKPSF